MSRRYPARVAAVAIATALLAIGPGVSHAGDRNERLHIQMRTTDGANDPAQLREDYRASEKMGVAGRSGEVGTSREGEPGKAPSHFERQQRLTDGYSPF